MTCTYSTNLQKRLFIILFFAFANYQASQAKLHGYRIQVQVANCQDTTVQLCTYYGKPGMVNIVSTQTVKKGPVSNFQFESNEKIAGGIYMILFKNKRSQYDFVINDGDELSISYDFNQPMETVKLKGPEEALDYLAYQQLMGKYNPPLRQLNESKKTARNKSDSLTIQKKIDQLNKEMESWRTDYIQRKPQSLLSKFFHTAYNKEIPPSIQGNTEKEKAFIREHIWDNFDFTDNRLAFTPFIESKWSNYLSVLPPQADSINFLTDQILKKMESARELYKLSLDWLVRTQENAKVQFGDDCFIHLVEMYYLNGKAEWAKDSTLKSYRAKMSILGKNIMGMKAPDFQVLTDKEQPMSLSSIYPRQDYTLLIFWSPTCNHCVDEIPKLDSVVAKLGKKMQIVGVDAHGEGPAWKKWISEHSFKAPWIHLYDPQKKGQFVSNYAVYTTPAVYLLNNKGIIIGKRFTYGTLEKVIEDLEKKK